MMVHKQHTTSVDDGVKKLETQFQVFADTTTKKFDLFDARQSGFEAKILDFIESTKRVKEIFLQMKIVGALGLSPVMNSRISVGSVGFQLEVG